VRRRPHGIEVLFEATKVMFEAAKVLFRATKVLFQVQATKVLF